MSAGHCCRLTHFDYLLYRWVVRGDCRHRMVLVKEVTNYLELVFFIFPLTYSHFPEMFFCAVIFPSWNMLSHILSLFLMGLALPSWGSTLKSTGIGYIRLEGSFCQFLEPATPAPKHANIIHKHNQNYTHTHIYI